MVILVKQTAWEIPGPDFIELLKHKTLLNKFLLSKKKKAGYQLNNVHVTLYFEWLPESANHNCFVLSSPDLNGTGIHHL